MNDKIVLDDYIISYVIIRKNIKNIYFRVKEDLVLYITCSSFVTMSYIKKLINDEKDNIIKMYEKMLKRVENNDIYYLGNKLDLFISNTKPYIETYTIYAKCYEDAKKYIYSLSLDVFSSRLRQIRNNFNNLPEFTLRVRHMTTKWGVCNKSSMTVTLNTELITKDVHLIDYVLVHELCHFKYMNHSKEYWEYVSSFYPYYKNARKELNY